MTSRTRLLVLLVTAPLLAYVILGAFLGRVAVAGEEAYPHLNVFQDVLQLITSNYVEPVDVDRVMDGAMRGLAEGAGPDSAYLSRDLVREYQKGTPPPGTVGIDLTRQYYLRVIAVRDGSPAQKAGILSGDYLRAIDGKATREMSVFEGMRALGGAPGSTVKLAVIRGNAADPHPVDLVRVELPPPEVSARSMAGGVGYLRIPGFDANTAGEIRARVDDLTRGGATRLAIDIRSSASGPLDAGISAARLFVRSATLVLRESRGSERNPIAATAEDGQITLPAVVLVDAGTSGPAELFAAALSGTKRAALVGERTQGHAAIPALMPLPDGSALLLSTSWFLTAAGEPIHQRGITPDVEVEVPDIEFGAPPPVQDVILQKALERR